MSIRIRFGDSARKSLFERLRDGYVTGPLRLVRRIQALLYLADGSSVAEVAEMLGIGEQTVRDYLGAFIVKGVASLVYQRPPGRPARLTKTQRRELAEMIKAGPEAAGYEWGCWTGVLIQDLIKRHFAVEYSSHYICELLDTLGFSIQKARFVSDHLDEAARKEWMEKTWPQILRLAKAKGALILFGDEAGFAQWGSLSYTWAPKGEQPTVKTSGRRKAYKVFGLIDYFSGRFLYKGQTGRFNAESYSDFLLEVLAKTKQYIILIQDGAKYHTSKAMQQFFADHADRLIKFQLPSYSPDFNPIEFLWKKIKKRATHLRYFAEFAKLTQKVDDALLHFATAPSEITALMGQYCESLGSVPA